MKKKFVTFLLGATALLSTTTLVGCEDKNAVYQISVEANMGYSFYVDGDGKYKSGETVTLVARDVEGCTFSCWMFEGVMVSTDKEFSFKVNSKLDGTYIAIYEPKTYAVTVADGITLSVTDSAKFKSDVSVVNSPANRAGYSCKTYYVVEGLSTKNYFVNTFIMPAKNVSVNYEYVLDSYTLEYELNGGTLSEEPKTTFTILDEDYTLPTPTKEGCTFTGWSTLDNPIPKMQVVLEQGSYGNKKYVANWEAKSYGITAASTTNGEFKIGEYAGGLEVIEQTSAKFGSKVEVHCFTTVAGYDVSRVYYVIEGTETQVDVTNKRESTWTFTMPAGNVTVYVNYAPVNYAITYNLDGGEFKTESKNTYTVLDETYTILTPVKEGHTFLGWTYYGQETPKLSNVTIEQGSYGEKEFTAHWQINTYSISTIPGENGTYSVNVQSATYGSEVVVTAVASEGYEIKKIYYVTNTAPIQVVDINNNKFNMPADDVIVHCDFGVITYDITYELDGGEIIDAKLEYASSDADYTLPTPTKEGYTFMGWITPDNDVAELNMVIPSGSAEDKTFIATWSVNRYTITNGTSSADGTVNIVTTATYNSEVSFTITPKAEKQVKEVYYIAAGTSEKVYITNNKFTMPASNITLTVVFERITYSITYNLDGGTFNGFKYNSYTYFTSAIEVAAPTKEGHTFLGWSGTGLTDLVQTFTIPTNSSGNRTYTANWQVNSYVLYNTNFVLSDGSTNSNGASYWYNNFGETTYTWGNGKSYNYGTEIKLATSIADINFSSAYTTTESDFTVYLDAAYNHSDKYISRIYYKIQGDETEYEITDNILRVPAGNFNIYCVCEDTTKYEYENVIYSLNPVTLKAKAVEATNSNINIYSSLTYNGTKYTVEGVDFGYWGTVREITSIYIANGISYIESITSSNLSSLDIPKSVKFIGYIGGTTGTLERITINEQNEYFDASYENMIVRKSDKKLMCVTKTATTIPEGVEIVESFDTKAHLTTLIVPEGVKVIESHAFQGLSMTELVLPNSLTKIGVNAFIYCENLTSITIPKNVSSIGYGFIHDCPSITSINVDSENTTYSDGGMNVVYDVTTNTLIATINTIPKISGMTAFDKNVFTNPDAVTEVYIPEGISTINSISYNTFQNSNYISTVIIDSAYAYKKFNNSSTGYAATWLIKATTIKVSVSAYSSAENSYLTNENNYTMSAQPVDGYYIFTKKA